MALQSLYSQVGKDEKSVFSLVLNIRGEFEDVTSDGRLFQILAYFVSWSVLYSSATYGATEMLYWLIKNELAYAFIFCTTNRR